MSTIADNEQEIRRWPLRHGPGVVPNETRHTGRRVLSPAPGMVQGSAGRNASYSVGIGLCGSRRRNPGRRILRPFPVSTEHTGPRLPRAESGRTGPQTPPRGEVGGEK